MRNALVLEPEVFEAEAATLPVAVVDGAVEAEAVSLAVPVPEAAVEAAALPLPAGVAHIASEAVLLLRVSLPKLPRAQWRSAVAYAVEDRIAQPLEAVAVVLGPDLGGRDAPGSFLVAVVDRTVLRARLALPDMRGHLRLQPDVLVLPCPAEACWNVWQAGSRVLVRTSDGTGFATDPAALPLYWRAAGAPAITLFGGMLPDAIPVAGRAVLAAAQEPALARFDLAATTGPGTPLPRGVGAVAVVLVLAAALHLAVLAADVLALGRSAAAAEAALRAAVARGGQPVTGDLDQALEAVLAAQNPPEPGGFLPLLSRVLAALQAEAGSVTVQSLSYDAKLQQLRLTLEAPDLGTLQTVEALLGAAGVVVQAGAATSGEGVAQVQMTLQDGT